MRRKRISASFEPIRGDAAVWDDDWNENKCSEEQREEEYEEEQTRGDQFEALLASYLNPLETAARKLSSAIDETAARVFEEGMQFMQFTADELLGTTTTATTNATTTTLRTTKTQSAASERSSRGAQTRKSSSSSRTTKHRDEEEEEDEEDAYDNQTQEEAIDGVEEWESAFGDLVVFKSAPPPPPPPPPRSTTKPRPRKTKGNITRISSSTNASNSTLASSGTSRSKPHSSLASLRSKQQRPRQALAPRERHVVGNHAKSSAETQKHKQQQNARAAVDKENVTPMKKDAHNTKNIEKKNMSATKQSIRQVPTSSSSTPHPKPAKTDESNFMSPAPHANAMIGTPEGTGTKAMPPTYIATPPESALSKQLVRQMEHLVQEKGRLAQENAKLSREVERMSELLRFTMGGGDADCTDVGAYGDL